MLTPTPITQRNRVNAQHATGPKTPAGKAKSSQNARKFGLFVSDATLELEDPNEFATILAEYIADYLPYPGIETELVRQLSVATHRLRRLDRIENAALFTEAVAHTRHEANVLIEESFERSFALMEKIMRARAAAERSFNRVYKDLEARKAERVSTPASPKRLEIEVDTRHQPILQNEPKPSDEKRIGPLKNADERR